MNTPRIIRLVAWALLLAGWTATPSAVRAADTDDCATPPAGITIAAGEEVRFGGAGWRLDARVDLSGAIDIDLLARPIHPRLGETRRGGFVPHLGVEYTLEGGATGAGKLPFRLSDAGPSYGARLSGSPSDPFTVEVTVRSPQGPRIRSSTGSVCSPLQLTFAVDPAALPRSKPEAPQKAAAGGDPLAFRMNRVGGLDPRPAETYSDVWGYSSGDVHLAILGAESGTVFIDVSDPAQPVETGFIAGPSSAWRDIKTYDHYAYIVTEGVGAGEGMQIVNLANPLSPTLVTTYAATFHTAHNLYIDQAAARAWIAGSDAGLRILSLQNPTAPTEIGSFTLRYVHDVYAASSLAYLSEGNNGVHEIASGTGPLIIRSTFPTPGHTTHNSWANESRTLLATTDETSGGHVAIYDISNFAVSSPLVSEFQPVPSSIVHNVMFDDFRERLAMSHYTLGMRLADLHRPTHPIDLGGYDTYPTNDLGQFSGAWGIYAFDPRGYFYVSDILTGLYVLEYAPTGGVLSGIVSDSDTGRPLAGVNVAELSSGLEMTTDDDGLYATYAPAGELMLRVKLPGYRTQFLQPDPLEPGARLDVDIDLEPLPTAPLSGFLLSRVDRTPLPNERVRVGGQSGFALTAADGRFDFPAVGVGQRLLRAEPAGFSTGLLEIVVQPSGLQDVEFLVDPAIFYDAAETDIGWSLGLPDDTATSGEWERVDPNGTGGGLVQPNDDATAPPGVLGFITGQSPIGADIESNDVDSGWTTLVSPPIDVSSFGAARLRYKRWISTKASFADGGVLRVEISSDGGSTWTRLESVGEDENSWTTREYLLDELVPLTANMRLRFVASAFPSFPEGRVLECGVDDVVVVPDCDARLAVGRADSDGDRLTDICDACPLDPWNDEDADGVCGNLDNAPTAPNADQLDGDMDGVGDAGDNCPGAPNPDQRDLDRDGAGDACDTDIDGDGVLDASDADLDNDGVANIDDVCMTVPDGAQPDADSDGVGDACDDDDGQVQSLRFTTALRLTWDRESDAEAYYVYRGDLGTPALVPLAGCLAGPARALDRIDPLLPNPDEGFFYLVTRVSDAGEGPAGADSLGVPRVIAKSCSDGAE